MQITAHRILSAPERAVYVVLDGRGTRGRVNVTFTSNGPSVNRDGTAAFALRTFASDVTFPDKLDMLTRTLTVKDAVRQQASADALDDFNREKRA